MPHSFAKHDVVEQQDSGVIRPTCGTRVPPFSPGRKPPTGVSSPSGGIPARRAHHPRVVCCASHGRKDVRFGCDGGLQVVRHVPGSTHVLDARNRHARELDETQNTNVRQPRPWSANEEQSCIRRRDFLHALARRRRRWKAHVATRRVQARASATRQKTVLFRTYATRTVLNVQLFSRICAYKFRRSTSNPTLIFKSWSSCTCMHRRRPRRSVRTCAKVEWRCHPSRTKARRRVADERPSSISTCRFASFRRMSRRPFRRSFRTFAFVSIVRRSVRTSVWMPRTTFRAP